MISNKIKQKTDLLLIIVYAPLYWI